MQGFFNLRVQLTKLHLSMRYGGSCLFGCTRHDLVSGADLSGHLVVGPRLADCAGKLFAKSSSGSF